MATWFPPTTLWHDDEYPYYDQLLAYGIPTSDANRAQVTTPGTMMRPAQLDHDYQRYCRPIAEGNCFAKD